MCLSTLAFTFQDLSEINHTNIYMFNSYLHLMFSDSDLKLQITIFLLYNALIPLLYTRKLSLLNKLQSTGVVAWSTKLKYKGCTFRYVVQRGNSHLWMMDTWIWRCGQKFENIWLVVKLLCSYQGKILQGFSTGKEKNACSHPESCY